MWNPDSNSSLSLHLRQYVTKLLGLIVCGERRLNSCVQMSDAADVEPVGLQQLAVINEFEELAYYLWDSSGVDEVSVADVPDTVDAEAITAPKRVSRVKELASPGPREISMLAEEDEAASSIAISDRHQPSSVDLAGGQAEQKSATSSVAEKVDDSKMSQKFSSEIPPPVASPASNQQQASEHDAKTSKTAVTPVASQTSQQNTTND